MNRVVRAESEASRAKVEAVRVSEALQRADQDIQASAKQSAVPISSLSAIYAEQCVRQPCVLSQTLCTLLLRAAGSKIIMTCLAQPDHIISFIQGAACTIRRRRGAPGSLAMSQFAAPFSSLHYLSGLQALHRALDEAEVQKNALGTQLQAIRQEEEQSRAALEVGADARHAAWQGPRAFLSVGAQAIVPDTQLGQGCPTHWQWLVTEEHTGSDVAAEEHTGNDLVREEHMGNLVLCVSSGRGD